MDLSMGEMDFTEISVGSSGTHEWGDEGRCLMAWQTRRGFSEHGEFFGFFLVGYAGVHGFVCLYLSTRVGLVTWRLAVPPRGREDEKRSLWEKI
jgi:hypothetical protein